MKNSNPATPRGFRPKGGSPALLHLADGGMPVDPLIQRLQGNLNKGTLTMRGASLLGDIQGRANTDSTNRYGIDTQASTAANTNATNRYGIDTQATTAANTNATNRYGIDTQATTATNTNTTNRYGIDTQAATSKYNSDNQVLASKYGADTQAASSKYNSDNSLTASQYGADVGFKSNMYSTDGKNDPFRFYGSTAPQSNATASVFGGTSYIGGAGGYGQGASYGADFNAKYGTQSNDANRLGFKHGGDLQTGKGGHVPGSGKGDKIPAKYEPGEFVVSNAMLEKNPGLREQLHSLRADALADKGMTPEQADAKAVGPRGFIRAEDGYITASELQKLVEQIPGNGQAPAPDGIGDNTELSRNINNSLNALGGMGVVSSVPLGFGKLAQGTALATTRPVAASAPAFQSLPAVNVALQEGAQANALAGATRSLGNASAGLNAAGNTQAAPANVTEPRNTGVSGSWDSQAPQSGAGGTWAAPEAQAPQSEYARQMGKVGGFFVDGMKTLVSAPGYGLNKAEAAGPAAQAPVTTSTAGAGRGTVNPTQADTRAALESQPAAAAAAANPNQITVTRQPNGTMAFSGGPNIGKDGGEISYASPAGFKPSGFGVSTPGSAGDGQRGMEMNNRLAAEMRAERMAQEAAAAANAPARLVSQFERRNAEVSANSRYDGPSRQIALKQLAAMDAQDAQSQKGAVERQQRYADGMTAQAANAPVVALKQREAAMAEQKQSGDATVQGFQIRGLQQIEALRAAYDKADAKDKPAIAEQIRVLTGKDKADQYTVAAGGQQVDERGMVYKTPDRVFNKGTGKFVEQDTPQQVASNKPVTKAEYDKLPKGAKYTAPNGSILIKG